MRITYSPTADALAIRLVENRHCVATQVWAPNVTAEVDARGRLIGIHLLGASRVCEQRVLAALPAPSRWLTLSEAAKLSGLSKAVLRRHIHRGHLPADRQRSGWLIAAPDLLSYLEGGLAEVTNRKAQSG